MLSCVHVHDLAVEVASLDETEPKLVERESEAQQPIDTASGRLRLGQTKDVGSVSPLRREEDELAGLKLPRRV